MNVDTGETALRGLPRKKKIPYRERPDDFAICISCDNRRRVRLLIVRSELCKYFVEAAADRTREPQFVAYTPADLIGRLLHINPAPGTGKVQPAFVKTERLHPVRILTIDLMRLAGIVLVLIVMTRNDHEPGTFLPGLPDRLCGPDPEIRREPVLGEDNSVAHLAVAADRHGNRL